MKTRLPIFLASSLATFWLSAESATQTHSLLFEIEPRLAGAPIVCDVLTRPNSRSQLRSVTRLDLLLSGIALRRSDGSWAENPDWFAYVNARDGRLSFAFEGAPAGRYDRLRFSVGIAPELNHANPAQFPADHPLNPVVNGLHWNWQGGYVFLALEGNWISPEGQQRGYSYHIATDSLLARIELAGRFEASQDCKVRLVLDLDEIVPERITEANASTHSRSGDDVAIGIYKRMGKAFRIENVSPVASPAMAPTISRKLEAAPNATPYPLTISAFFPKPSLPLDNPLTIEGVALGRRLFEDANLSRNNKQSCASCHRADLAFSDSQRFNLGVDGQPGNRNVMPLFNLAWKGSFFWDGRAPTLREQVLQPIQNPVEMHETLTNVLAKLTAANYAELFLGAFGTSEITADRMARALEQFLLSQVSRDSRFDRFLAGELDLTAEEKRGFELFHTEYDPRRGQFGADCFHCHGGPLFQSQAFGNNGLDLVPTDLGRMQVTQKPGDSGKFAVPSLRNVAVTAPYMHDGRFATLDEVIRHYSTGVKRGATLDPNLAKHPDGGVPLSVEDRQALIAFLETLTDAKYIGSFSPMNQAGLSPMPGPSVP